MARLTIPAEEYMLSGHVGCPGCAATLAMRYVLKGVGPGAIITVPACCWAVMSGAFPRTCVTVPFLDNAFEATGASISGLRSGLNAIGAKGATVVGFAGDGGTVDIGIQSLSGALERETDAIYVMYDNEAYMNTGNQRSGATPMGAWTTTTQVGKNADWKREPKKDIMAIVAAHRVPYAATASVGFPEEFVKKVQRAKEIKGSRFFHVFSPCPPGWKYPPERTIEIARLAVETNVFPLYEIVDGTYVLNRKPGRPKPVAEYLKAQGRFAHLKPADVEAIQREVDANWKRLLGMEKLTAETPLPSVRAQGGGT